MFCCLNRSKKRHTPTRMPYSCQLQFGTSGRCVTPAGGPSTWRAIGLPMSQTSRLTMVQNTSRALLGSFSAGRSTIAENSARSRGSIGLSLFLFAFFLAGFFIRHPRPADSRCLNDASGEPRQNAVCVKLCGEIILWRTDIQQVATTYGKFAAVFARFRCAITRTLGRADSDCSLRRIDHLLEPISRGLIIFPAIENPHLIPPFADFF